MRVKWFLCICICSVYVEEMGQGNGIRERKFFYVPWKVGITSKFYVLEYLNLTKFYGPTKIACVSPESPSFPNALADVVEYPCSSQIEQDIL